MLFTYSRFFYAILESRLVWWPSSQGGIEHRKEVKLLTAHIIRHKMTTSGDHDQSTGCICSVGGRQEWYDFRHFLHLSGTPNGIHQLTVFQHLKIMIRIMWKFCQVSFSGDSNPWVWVSRRYNIFLFRTLTSFLVIYRRTIVTSQILWPGLDDNLSSEPNLRSKFSIWNSSYHQTDCF